MTEMTKFDKDDHVTRELHGYGHITKEDATVLRVDEDGVWLDNGVGNDPSGPFDPITGWSIWDAHGLRQRIIQTT